MENDFIHESHAPSTLIYSSMPREANTSSSSMNVSGDVSASRSRDKISSSSIKAACLTIISLISSNWWKPTTTVSISPCAFVTKSDTSCAFFSCFLKRTRNSSRWDNLVSRKCDNRSLFRFGHHMTFLLAPTLRLPRLFTLFVQMDVTACDTFWIGYHVVRNLVCYPFKDRKMKIRIMRKFGIVTKSVGRTLIVKLLKGHMNAGSISRSLVMYSSQTSLISVLNLAKLFISLVWRISLHVKLWHIMYLQAFIWNSSFI